MSDQPTTTPATETPKAETTFVKIDRDLFDKVQAYASKGFLENQLPKMTDAQLVQMEGWVRGLRAQKKQGVFLSMPVSTARQTEAGRIYLQDLSRIQGKIREVKGMRLAALQFTGVDPVPAQAEPTTPAAEAAEEQVAAA